MVRSLRLLSAISVLFATISLSRVGSNPTGESTACQDALVLTDPNRHFSMGNIDDRCDNHFVTTWYRFELNGQPAVIPTTCIMNNHCGTQVPLHLDTGGRDLPGVNQTDQFYVCASYNVLGKWDCCVLREKVYVKNCGDYYVYYLRPPDRCPVGYCVQESNQQPYSNITAKTGEYIHSSDNPGHSSSENNDTSGTSTTESANTTSPTGAHLGTATFITPRHSNQTISESNVLNVTSIPPTIVSLTSATPDFTVSSTFAGYDTTFTDISNLTTVLEEGDPLNETTTTISKTSVSISSLSSGPKTTQPPNDDLSGYNQTCGDNSTQFVCGNNTCFHLNDRVEIICRVNTTHLACVQACDNYPECENSEDEQGTLCSNGGCAEGQQYCPNRQGCFSDCTEPREVRILTFHIRGENYTNSSEILRSPTINRDLKMVIIEGLNRSSVSLNQTDVSIVNTSMVGAGNLTLEVTVSLNVSEIVAIDELMSLFPNTTFLDLLARLLYGNKEVTERTETIYSTTQSSITSSENNSTSGNSSSSTLTTSLSNTADSVTPSNKQSTLSIVQLDNSPQAPISSHSTYTPEVTLAAETSETLTIQFQADAQTPTSITNRTEAPLTSQSHHNQTTVSPTITESKETQISQPMVNSSSTSQMNTSTDQISSSSNQTTSSLVFTSHFLDPNLTDTSETGPSLTSTVTAPTTVLNSPSASDELISTAVSQTNDYIQTTDIPMNLTQVIDTEGLQHTITHSNSRSTHSPTLTTVQTTIGTSQISTSNVHRRTSTQESTSSNRNDTGTSETGPASTFTSTFAQVTSTLSTIDTSSVTTSIRTSIPDISIQTSTPTTMETSQITRAETATSSAAAQSSEYIPSTTAQSVSPLFITLQTNSTSTLGISNSSTSKKSIMVESEHTTQSIDTSINTEMTTSDRTTHMEQRNDSLISVSISSTGIESSPTTVEATQTVSEFSPSSNTTEPSIHIPSTESVEKVKTTTPTTVSSLATTSARTSMQTSSTTPKDKLISQASTKDVDTTFSNEITTTISNKITDTSDNMTNIQVTDAPNKDDENAIVVFFRQNEGLFIFLVVASAAMLGICLFGIVGTIYQRRMRTWSPDETLDDTYPDMEKSMISIGREGTGVESPIPDVDILKSEQTGEGESLSKASTLVCRSPADRLQGTSTGSPDTPIRGTCRETQAGFRPLNGHANEAYQSDESIDLDGVTPFDELDEKPPRNMFPWIETAEDTKV